MMTDANGHGTNAPANPLNAVLPADARSVRPDWLEVICDGEPRSLTFTDEAGRWLARWNDLEIQVKVAEPTTDGGPLRRVWLHVTNRGDQPRKVNLKWTLHLGDQSAPPRWLVPALIYKEAVQHYPGVHPSLIGDDLELHRSPWWVLRSDLCAVPMVMAWTSTGSLAMVMDEHEAGHMTSIGLDHRAGQRAVIGAWPYREQPRRREVSRFVENRYDPVVTFATLEPGSTTTLWFELAAGDADPHAYGPILRQTFERLDAEHPTAPRTPLSDAADTAAYGLMKWHYDADHRALWETAAWEAYYGKEGTFFDRYEMHVAFTSGIPYAFALLDHAQSVGDDDAATAARRVIDRCCEGITPCGLFWSLLHRDRGWSTGWPSPQRQAANPDKPGREVGDLQARTMADACLFLAMAIILDPDAPRVESWRNALRSNLDYILSIQRPDGNPGQAYMPDGRVLDWDGEEGLMWIAALVEGAKVLGDEKYLDAANRAGAHYLPAIDDAYLTGAPEAMHLLPTSEDPQNAVIAYVRLYDATNDSRWLDAARKAGEFLMTYRWQYNTRFPADAMLARYRFATKGMDVSSPNNSHLHPFGLIAIPELIRLWDHTGDDYLLRQTRNNLQACTQIICWADGVYNGFRGMSTERFVQSDFDLPKGTLMQLAHAWTTGCLLYASRFVSEQASVCIDEATGRVVALESVDLTNDGGRWTVANPWDKPIPLKLRRRDASGAITTRQMQLPARGTATLD